MQDILIIIADGELDENWTWCPLNQHFWFIGFLAFFGCKPNPRLLQFALPIVSLIGLYGRLAPGVCSLSTGYLRSRELRSLNQTTQHYCEWGTILNDFSRLKQGKQTCVFVSVHLGAVMNPQNIIRAHRLLEARFSCL